MNARAADADKHTQIPTGPSGMLVSLAVCTNFIALEFDQCLEGLGILCGPVGACSRPSRHGLSASMIKGVAAMESMTRPVDIEERHEFVIRNDKRTRLAKSREKGSRGRRKKAVVPRMDT